MNFTPDIRSSIYENGKWILLMFSLECYVKYIYVYTAINEYTVYATFGALDMCS